MTDTSTLVEYLGRETHSDHQRVDELVQSGHSFDNQENYQKFLQLQEIFHKIVDRIYHDNELNKEIKNLKELSRYHLVKRDMEDLKVAALVLEDLPMPQGEESLGWLYCAEGSNLGAAFLLKWAKEIDLNENFGARHLAPHPQGRSKHWKEFSELLNRFEEKGISREKVLKGAKEAFGCYQMIIKTVILAN